jgi:hypothetical protein
MVCQYSTCGLVSSGKRDRALDPGVVEGGGDASNVATGTVIVLRFRALPEYPTAITRRAYSPNVLSSRRCWRWSVDNMRSDRLASDLHKVTPTCRPSSPSSTLGRADTAPRDAHQCVKNVPCIMMYWLGRASLLPRQLGDVFTRRLSITPPSEIAWCGARNGRVVTHMARSPVRPAML